jgi:hypothetical protein
MIEDDSTVEISTFFFEFGHRNSVQTDADVPGSDAWMQGQDWLDNSIVSKNLRTV